MAKHAAPATKRSVADDWEPATDAREPLAEEISQEAPEELNGQQGKVTQAEAVRQAIAAGADTAKTGSPWILKHFGMSLSASAFAAAKSQMRRRDDGGPGAAQRQQASRPASSPVGVPQGFGADVKAIRLLLQERDNDAEALKDLIGTIDTLLRKYGVSGLDEMITAFAE